MYRIRRQPLEQRGQVAADELALHRTISPASLQSCCQPALPASNRQGATGAELNPTTHYNAAVAGTKCGAAMHYMVGANSPMGWFPLTSQLLWEQKGVGTSQRHAQPLQGRTGWLSGLHNVRCSSESCTPTRLQLAERRPAGLRLAVHHCCRVRRSPGSGGRQRRRGRELQLGNERPPRSSAACFVKR